MQFLVLMLVILALVAGPQFWVKRVISRYNRPVDRYEASGAQTARRLLDAHGLQAVVVETTEHGDHYDPAARAVRLSADNYHGRSLTATTIAAHEVGHALQHARGEVARALHVEQGTDVFHVLLVHRENGLPIQLEDRHVVADFAPDCLEQDFGRITPSAWLTAISPLQEAEQVVRAAQPNAAVRKHLNMRDDEPSLVVLRRTWSHGRPVTFARLHHPASRYELTGHYTPPGTPRSTSPDVVELEKLEQ